VRSTARRQRTRIRLDKFNRAAILEVSMNAADVIKLCGLWRMRDGSEELYGARGPVTFRVVPNRNRREILHTSRFIGKKPSQHSWLACKYPFRAPGEELQTMRWVQARPCVVSAAPPHVASQRPILLMRPAIRSHFRFAENCISRDRPEYAAIGRTEGHSATPSASRPSSLVCSWVFSSGPGLFQPQARHR
jgi:hypothetical protein